MKTTKMLRLGLIAPLALILAACGGGAGGGDDDIDPPNTAGFADADLAPKVGLTLGTPQNPDAAVGTFSPKSTARVRGDMQDITRITFAEGETDSPCPDGGAGFCLQVDGDRDGQYGGIDSGDLQHYSTFNSLTEQQGEYHVTISNAGEGMSRAINQEGSKLNQTIAYIPADEASKMAGGMYVMSKATGASLPGAQANGAVVIFGQKKPARTSSMNSRKTA